jgi:adenylate cyclase class 2
VEKHRAKATDPDPSASLEVCSSLGAEDRGTIAQRDTYFEVARGGLKLREEQPGHPHLIQFERASEPQQRESRYRIIEVSDGAALCAALAAAIGIRGVVAKRRHLLLWQSVRIHLDEVEQLGTFIELEAVAPAASDLAHEHRLVAELRDALGITDERLVSLGYAAQLLQAGGDLAQVERGRHGGRAGALRCADLPERATRHRAMTAPRIGQAPATTDR